MKKIIVFGASGATGSAVVKQALEAGHKVTAVVRNPDGFASAGLTSTYHPNLIISQGDVMQPASFAGAMSGQDVVISALGSRSAKATTLYSTGIKNIIASMQENKVKRIICFSASALYTNPKMGLLVRLITTLILQRILKGPYADLRLMETTVQQSQLDYTIIRPPRLTNKPMKGKYRDAVNEHLGKAFVIARADLAHYMLNHMEDSLTFRSIVEIAY